MTITLAAVVLDAADLETESRFWGQLLDGQVERRERHHLVRVDGSPIIAVQLAPDHVPPSWPDGEPQQVHLDFVVDDIDTAHRRAVEAGARVLSRAEESSTAAGFRVYADPAGHPFCLCWE